MDRYIPTGNEFVSLPLINEVDAAIESINFLHMGYKGMIEIAGNANERMPLLQPFIEISGEKAKWDNFIWRRRDYWIPEFEASCERLRLNGTILAPLGERGFVYRMEIHNVSDEMQQISFGLGGTWAQSIHTINVSKPMLGEQHAFDSSWNHSFLFEFRNLTPVFSFAPIISGELEIKEYCTTAAETKFRLGREIILSAGEKAELILYWGIGFEEVAAATAAKEMLRHTYARLLERTSAWLRARIAPIHNDRLNQLYYTNLFFNYFYASGITLDTEQLVLVTSRSPRYYVSAAYWDRDSLLWSFPAMLITDHEHARKMLEYVFDIQIRNVGIHSRYIDGTLLEPGFELDELCAPIIALYRYIKLTGDQHLIRESRYASGIEHILSILIKKKHSDTALYETFLQPTDDEILYPYLTYNNALVSVMLRFLAELLEESKGSDFSNKLLQMSEATRTAIYANCVFEHKGKKVFAWSIDLEGHWNIYDEPPGSLLLLAHYGFCDRDDPIYHNTVALIHDPEYRFSFSGSRIAEIGCEHAPHPWVLSIANTLLAGAQEERFLQMLPHLHMDNGIACESVDEHTGECTTGEAFATCAGFLAYAIHETFYKSRQNNFSEK